MIPFKRTSTLGIHYTNEYVTFENGSEWGCVVMWTLEIEIQEGKIYGH